MISFLQPEHLFQPRNDLRKRLGVQLLDAVPEKKSFTPGNAESAVVQTGCQETGRFTETTARTHESGTGAEVVCQLLSRIQVNLLALHTGFFLHFLRHERHETGYHIGIVVSSKS